MLKKAPNKSETWKLPWVTTVSEDMYFHAVDDGEEPFLRLGEYLVAVPIPFVAVDNGDLVVVRITGGFTLRKVATFPENRNGRELSMGELAYARVVGVVTHFCRDAHWKPLSGDAKAIANRLLGQTLKEGLGGS